MTEVHLVTPARSVLRGIDAVLFVAAAIPWAKPVTWAARLPGVTPILRMFYRTFARNRYKLSAACALDRRAAPGRAGRWILPAILVLLTVVFVYFAIVYALAAAFPRP